MLQINGSSLKLLNCLPKRQTSSARQRRGLEKRNKYHDDQDEKQAEACAIDLKIPRDQPVKHQQESDQEGYQESGGTDGIECLNRNSRDLRQPVFHSVMMRHGRPLVGLVGSRVIYEHSCAARYALRTAQPCLSIGSGRRPGCGSESPWVVMVLSRNVRTS